MFETTAALDALPVAVYVTDAEGRITYFNPAAAKFWGRAPRLNHDRWCGSWRLYHPDGAPMAFEDCPMAITLKQGEPVHGATAVMEREDGTRAPFMPVPNLLRDEAGKVTGAINMLVDISDRQHTEQELAKLASIVTGSDDAILSKSLNGTILSWNAGAQRIFGYDAAEMVGQNILKLIPPELHDEERYILGLLSRGERVDHYETVRVAKDGRRLHISLTVSPLRDQSGTVVGASKIARDVTERKRHEEMQELLVSELNHRVKNSLATVQGIANQTLRYTDTSEEFVSTFNRRIRAFARAHSLLLRQKLQGAELSDLLREEAEYEGGGAQISYSGPLVNLDPDLTLQLALVLHELVANAREFGALSAPEGQLAVSWEVEKTHAERRLLLRWRESGGPRVVAPTSRGFGSQMIEKGLAAYRGMAALSFGADGVSCDIVLPLPDIALEQDGRGPLTSRLERANAPANIVEGKRVLVVEDEIVIALDIVDKLEERGCEAVGPAATFDEAQRLIEHGGFDCALLDANLAGRPVDELAAALTQKNIPFAFVTGYGREALPLAFRDAPMIAKPFSPQQINDLIEHIFTRNDETVALRQAKG